MKESPNKKAIISLAVLQTNYDNKLINGTKIGYIENFVLLCINLVKQNNYETINLENIEDFKNKFTLMYGLNIPIMILNTILSRAKKLKFFYKDHRELIPSKDMIEKQLPNNTTPKESIRKINQFHNEAKNYINFNFNTTYTREDIEIAVLKLLSKHNLELLYLSENKNSLLPDISSKSDDKFINLDYLIYKFIMHIESNDDNLFKIFEDLCVGYLLLNSIVYANESNTDGTLKKISLFLDTSIVLKLLGLEGENHKKKYEELIEYIKNNSKSISLKMFDKHFDELLNILDKAKKNIEENKKNHISTVSQFFIEKNYSGSDIQIIINSIEEKLKKLSIELYSNYSYEESDNAYQIDEAQLKEDIIQKYNYHSKNLSHSKEFAIEIDVVILAQIKRLQQGYIARNFSDIKNILLTDNIALSLAVKDYERKSQSQTATFIPSCLTDFFFFSQLWVHSNHIINNNGDIKSMIANTILSFEIDKKLKNSFYEKIEELKKSNELTEDQYVLLSSSQITDSILEEKTFGNYHNIDSKLPFEILEEINNNANKVYVKEKELHNNTKEKLNDTERELYTLKTTLEKKKGSCLSKISTFITMIVYLIFIIAGLTSLILHPNTPWWVNGVLIISTLAGISIPAIKAFKKDIRIIISKYLCKYSI